MKPPVRITPVATGPHPRNRHQGRYHFSALVGALPELRKYVVQRHGESTIDFADQRAVLALNRALLTQWYGIRGWDLPASALCPGVPGRADLIHHLADLLASDNDGKVPRGPAIRVVDIGVGANLIYPLIGHSEYGWRFVGVDVATSAIAHAQHIIATNPAMADAIELRLQADPLRIFDGVLRDDERYDLTLSNPPFHVSAKAVRQASMEKWRKLGETDRMGSRGSNFGGIAAELHCAGGELGFIRRMIEESALRPDQVRWYSSLVSQAANVLPLRKALKAVGAVDVRQIDMGQGQKLSRVLAWSYMDTAARRVWLSAGA